MWRLHRYYLKELAVNATITFVVLFTIVMISLVARGIQRAQGGGLLDAAMIMLFWTLDAFPHLLPISFLIATVQTFGRATQDREITAIRSAGISPRVPMTAAVLIGIVLSIIGQLVMHTVLPEVHFRKYRVGFEAFRNVLLNMKLGGANDQVSIPGTDMSLTFRMREQGRDEQDIVLSDCVLYVTDERASRQDMVSPILLVDRVWIPVPDRYSETLDIVLQGVEDPMQDTRVTGIPFRFPLRALSEGNRRSESDQDIGSAQLLSEVLRGVHEEPPAAIYALHRRTCFALLPLLLGPIGFCIALSTQYRGRAFAMLVTLLPLGAFYTGDVLGANLMRDTQQPLTGWLPAVLLCLLGTPFVWRELRR